MLELVEVPADKKVSIYVDRAIAADWFYEAILEHPQLEIITWEKGFKASPCNGSTDNCACCAPETMPKISRSIIFAISGARGKRILILPNGWWKRPIPEIKPLR